MTDVQPVPSTVVVVTHDPPRQWQHAAVLSLRDHGADVRVQVASGADEPSSRLARRVPALRAGGGAGGGQASPGRGATPDLVVDLTGSERGAGAPAAGEVWRLSNDPARACLDAVRLGTAVLDLALLDGGPGGHVVLGGRLPCFADSVPDTLTSALEALARWPALAYARRLAGVEGPVVAAGWVSVPDRAPLRALPRRLALRLSRVLLTERWNVGVVNGHPADLLAGTLPGPVRWLPQLPGGHGMADPFGVPGTRDLLAERIRRRGGFGDLVRLGLPDPAAEQVTAEPAPGLASATHRSFPFTFTWDGSTFCLPEAWEEGGVRLHRLVGTQWELERVLLPDVPAVDSVLFRHEERWWLLYGVHGPRQHDELHAAYADALDGPFFEHPLNPVLTDITAARNAGPPFWHDGAMYRVAQDCSRQYGGAVTVARVDALTPTGFRQEVVASVQPVAPYPAGLHTVCPADGRLLVDGKRLVLDPVVVLGKLARRLHRPRPGGSAA